MLDGAPQPVVPPDLTERAMAQGRVLAARRRWLRRAGWSLLLAAVAALTLWAVVTQSWAAPPTDTTPPLEGW